MKFQDEKHFGLRVDADTLAKFRLASDYEGRSANAQLVMMMRDFIRQYELKTGIISRQDIEEFNQD